MPVQTPALRHGQKEPETVFSGGKSCGRIRHWRPPTHPSKIAWMTSRKLGSRGRPPGFSGGSQSLISFHGLFVRSVGDLFFRLQCPYRLDGQVVKRSGSKQVQRFSSQLLIRNFSNSFLDIDTINVMQVITGNIPAEFGGRNAAVVIIQPKSG